MKKQLSRKLIAGASALLGATLLLGACRTNPNPAYDHWNVDTLQPRVARALTGYRADLDGSYREFHVAQRADINLTLRRHFLNNNPENPFQARDPLYEAGGRAPNSLLPYPLNWFHLEGLAIGLGFLAWQDVFLPIPVFSVIAALLPGGPEEFMAGLKEPFHTGSFGGVYEREPKPVRKFRIRNR